MPIVFKDSFLDQIQSLTKELFDKINEADDNFGKTWNGWNNKVGDVITENAIQEVNNMIDILEDYYTTGRSSYCTHSVCSGHTSDGGTYHSSHNSSVNNTYLVRNYSGHDLTNCTNYKSTCATYLQ